jgi:DNA-binding beta-propeller fold protein YncE
VDEDSNLWVVDRGNNRVQKFALDGIFLAVWGTQGFSPGQFLVPTSIAIDSGGNFYVAEVDNSRVQMFSPAGKYITELALGILSSPHGLAFDSNGNLYVGDTGDNSVKKFRLADWFTGS